MEQASALDRLLEHREVEAFLFHEALLQDQHRYDEWESLWAPDGRYWVPAGGDDIDPSEHVSIIYDNRTRLAGRIRQLKTGQRHAQKPQSSLRRLVSNVRVEHDDAEAGMLTVSSSFMLAEARHGRVHLWSGHVQHKLRREAGSFAIVLRKVMLVDNDQPIPNLAFLI